VVCNPAKLDPARLTPLVAAREHALKWAPTRWFTTLAADSGQAAARAALESRPSVVLVAGGDGTTRAVAQEAAGTGVPLAIIPVGSANVLARNLGLPRFSLDDAVQTAFAGRDHAVDVAMAELEGSDGATCRRSFLVMAGIGLDADIIAGTSPRAKRRLGWLAYAATSLPKLLGSRAFPARILVDGRAGVDLAAHTVAICNCGTLPGGVRLLPGARIDDGRLDLLVLSPRGPLGWVPIARRFFIDHRVSTRRDAGPAAELLPGGRARIQHLVCTAVTIQTDRPRACELDGEAFERIVRISAHIEPKALVVRVP
jgi:diacylglycerol kinase family enzyme